MSAVSSSNSLLNSNTSAYPTQSSLYSNGTKNSSSNLSSMSKLEPLLQSEEEPVKLHPLIIGNDVVVCMPEVNKVLRNVYQVLSQANYYLSKHGISSRRFTGAQLIKIKMLGILNHDAKVCSCILQQEAERIFDNFDLTGNSRKSNQIIWIDPILLDESPVNSKSGSPSQRGQSKDNLSAPPVEIQTFLLGTDVIVCAPDIQKVIQNHFNQGATTGYYFSKLGIVPYKFIHSAHLDKVKELGIIKKSAVHCTYVNKTDAIKVFEAYGMTSDDIKYNKIKWLNPVVLQEAPSGSSTSSNSRPTIKEEKITSPVGSPTNHGDDGSTAFEDEVSEEDASEAENDTGRVDPNAPLQVHPFIVEGKEVVCMPDVHRIVQSAHGNSIQVNYYLNKLHVKKKRFCFAHLRELKGRHILQNNATYCTYIPKADAEKIFQVYTLMGDIKISNLEWGEPISLDYGENGTKGSIHINTSNSPDGKEGEDDGIKVHTFCVDGDIVVCTPDVHRIVDFLEEQSASLDYHFRKLGITKHRYTYSQLHQLRRLQVIKRPTVCTFVKKLEVERLLHMYATDHNRYKIERVRWKEPVPLVASDHGPQPNPESPVGSPNPTMTTSQPTPTSAHPILNATADHGHHREPPQADYTISDLYSVFVGDKNENDSHESNTENHPVRLPLSSPTRNAHSLASPTTAVMEFQRANPHIDCPIVIPSGDYDHIRMSTVSPSIQHSSTTYTNSHASGRLASPCDSGNYLLFIYFYCV